MGAGRRSRKSEIRNKSELMEMGNCKNGKPRNFFAGGEQYRLWQCRAALCFALLVPFRGHYRDLAVRRPQRGFPLLLWRRGPDSGCLPPEDSTRTRACTQERNRSRDEIRLLCTAPTTPEAVCFPAAAQVARVRRQTTDRQSETVALLTSAWTYRWTTTVVASGIPTPCSCWASFAAWAIASL